MHSIFLRPWLAPSPAVVFDPLNIGIAFLVNVGYGGPIAGEAPARPPGVHGITCTAEHTWPPFWLTPEMPRGRAVGGLLNGAYLAGVDTKALVTNLLGLAARPNDSIFVAAMQDREAGPIAGAGICLEPAMFASDPVDEIVGPIRLGDMCAFILRGELVPRVKVFAGLVERHGERRACFYMAKPEGLVEANIDDVLWAARIKSPCATTGHDLLAQADAFVADFIGKHGIAGDLDTKGQRQAAWVQSMLAIMAVLRGQPE